MWSTLRGVFQRKSSMNKIKARREFYTVAMNVGEGTLGYINRVRNPEENLKAMGGEVTEMDVAMSVLNGLMSKYENLLVALDAKCEDELSLDFFNSRLLHKKMRQRDKSPATKRIGDMALVGANYRDQGRRGDFSEIEYYYCHKFGHISHDCPVLMANRQSKDTVAARADDDCSNSDDVICLVGNATDSDDISKSWLVDSAASAHMCWMRACFDAYWTTTGRRVTVSDKKSVATAVGESPWTRMTRPSGSSRRALVASLHVASPEGGDVWRPLGWVPGVAPNLTRFTPSWGVNEGEIPDRTSRWGLTQTKGAPAPLSSGPPGGAGKLSKASPLGAGPGTEIRFRPMKIFTKDCHRRIGKSRG